ncbi:MAG: NRDE family protein [Oceanococcus sp.]
MCLITFSWQPESETPLIVVANRDEQHARPTAPLAYWGDAPQVLAGRDLLAGGTWMGVTRDGRFAALTNIREPAVKPGVRSRGELVANYLCRPKPPLDLQDYAQTLLDDGAAYSGFNLLLGTRSDLVYLSNREQAPPCAVSPGVHGLSNALLDTPWPKLRSVTLGLDKALATGQDLPAMFEMMQRREPYPDESLPDTGVGLALERLLAPPFICSPLYGTRSISGMRLSQTEAQFIERRYRADGQLDGETSHNMTL